MDVTVDVTWVALNTEEGLSLRPGTREPEQT